MVLDSSYRTHKKEYWGLPCTFSITLAPVLGSSKIADILLAKIIRKFMFPLENMQQPFSLKFIACYGLLPAILFASTNSYLSLFTGFSRSSDYTLGTKYVDSVLSNCAQFSCSTNWWICWGWRAYNHCVGIQALFLSNYIHQLTIDFASDQHAFEIC